MWSSLRLQVHAVLSRLILFDTSFRSAFGPGILQAVADGSCGINRFVSQLDYGHIFAIFCPVTLQLLIEWSHVGSQILLLLCMIATAPA